MLVNKKLYRKFIDNDQFYMGLAYFISSFSKDPYYQSGVVITSSIVNKENLDVISMGINQPSEYNKASGLDWSKDKKEFFCNHALIVALQNINKNSLSSFNIYSTHLFCRSCSKLILNLKVSSITYLPILEGYKSKKEFSEKKYKDDLAFLTEISKFTDGYKTELKEYNGNLNWMEDHIINGKNLDII